MRHRAPSRHRLAALAAVLLPVIPAGLLAWPAWQAWAWTGIPGSPEAITTIGLAGALGWAAGWELTSKGVDPGKERQQEEGQ